MKKLLTMLLVIISIVGVFALAEKKPNQYLSFRDHMTDKGYEVEWDEYLLVAIARKDGCEIRLKNGVNYYVINGVLKEFKQTLKNVNGSIMLSVQDLESMTAKSEPAQAMLTVDYADFENLAAFYHNENLALLRATNDMAVDGAAMELQVETAAPMEMNKENSADYSGTNNQEEGVDEADFVKVDGKYIYLLGREGFKIVGAGSDLKLLQHLRFDEFEPYNLFVTNDRIVLLGDSLRKTKQIVENDGEISARYYYDNSTAVYVFEKTDFAQTAPKLLKKYYISGRINQARCIDNYVYIVANEYDYRAVPYFRVALEKADFKNGVEMFMDKIDFVNNQVTVDKICYFPQHFDTAMLYTVGINLDDLTKTGIDIDAYAGRADNIYVSQNNIYIANENYYDDKDYGKTEIKKFALNVGKVDYLANTKIKGRVHNQFSMGEYKENLRVATTNYDDVTGVSSNGLYILGKDLELLGSVDELAKGERIYSARMLGDKVYMVTFKETDPFYVIDAKDPTAPKVLGYLKLPGFSEYLHPYDENTIIGVGNDTHIEGEGRVVVDGVKVALFDVSDVSKPKLKDEVLIGSENTYTDIAYDHKAFLLAKSKNILAIPYSDYGQKRGDKNDVAILKIDDKGLEFWKDISHSTDKKSKNNYNDSYMSAINRVFYINDILYTLSTKELMANDLNNDLELIDILMLD